MYCILKLQPNRKASRKSTAFWIAPTSRVASHVRSSTARAFVFTRTCTKSTEVVHRNLADSIQQATGIRTCSLRCSTIGARMRGQEALSGENLFGGMETRRISRATLQPVPPVVATVPAVLLAPVVVRLRFEKEVSPLETRRMGTTRGIELRDIDSDADAEGKELEMVDSWVVEVGSFLSLERARERGSRTVHICKLHFDYTFY